MSQNQNELKPEPDPTTPGEAGVGSDALLAALDARIIEIECRIEALTSAIKLYANNSDLTGQRGVEAHTLSLLKIRRYQIAANSQDRPSREA